MRLRVLDLDGSVRSQMGGPEGFAASGVELIEASDLAPRLRIVGSWDALRDLTARLGPHEAASEPEVIFYGSGDFHHLTAQFVARLDENLTIIHFDNHPDWVRWPPTMNCGGWVPRALALRHVEKVITIGPTSDDLAFPEAKMADLAAVARGLHEMYPWCHPPTRVMRRYGDGPDRRQDGNLLRWRNLADEDWVTFWNERISAITTETVWITFDKDVLGPQEAVTNWDQGQLTLNRVETAIWLIAARKRIAGVDICGDYSRPHFNDAFRGALAWFDHPKRIEPSADALAVNARTNRRVTSLLEKVLA